MKLKIKKRLGEKKSEITEMRRAGDIPAVIYSKKGKTQICTVDGVEFRTHLRHIEKGSLPTVVFECQGDETTAKKVIVKEIQYHRTT